MNKLILTVAVSSILLCSCNQKSENKKVEVSEKKEFKANVDISTENISENEIKTIIGTNFPDNTSLTVTASREYMRKNSDERYAANLYSEFNSTVKNGEIVFSFDPHDNSWMEEYNELRKQNAEFDKSLTEIDKQSIKDSIEISVLFTPKKEQPQEVVKSLGDNGENLTGENVESLNGFKVYRKKINFYNKFKK